MPLEIRELHIRVNVAGEGAGPSPGAQASASGGEDKDRILSECVEEVLRVLRDRKER
jgi:hypothetical protein